MESYTIRIELREPTAKTQIELLYTMLEQGFSRTVVCERGQTFALPANEYVYIGSESIRSLTSRVASIVDSFSSDPLILVTQSAERCWSGLRGIDLT